eukprot:UN08218
MFYRFHRIVTRITRGEYSLAAMGALFIFKSSTEATKQSEKLAEKEEMLLLLFNET